MTQILNSNKIIGFTLPLNPSNGLPITNSFIATDAKRISEIFQNSRKSNYAYVLMAQPPFPNAAAFCLCVYGTDNIFKHSDVIKRWRTMKYIAKENGIDIVGFALDGDSRLLKTMRYNTLIPENNNFNNWFHINPDVFETIYIQDTVHIGKSCYLSMSY